MRILTWFSFLLVFTLLTAPTLGCSCGNDDDDDDDNGPPADDDADDDMDDDADDDADDDTGSACVDADGDTYGENCDAGPDCNDGDGTVWAIVTGYVDADGDAYPGTSVGLCTDGSLPPECYTDSTDCDDVDPTVYPGALEFPDDGIDQDCDDADITASESDGYFVDTAGGNDANPGTMDEPVETIQAGIDLAVADEDKPNVYIAEGTYTEDADVPLESVVNLYGGYDPETWTRDAKAPTILKADAAMMALVLRTESTLLVQGMTIIGGSGVSSQGIAADDYSNLIVADSRIETTEGTGTKWGIYFPSGNNLTIYRSSIAIEESTDGKAIGVNAGNVSMNIIDCDIHIAGAATTAGGIAMAVGNAYLSGVSVTIDESAGLALGIQAVNSSVEISDFSVSIGESSTTSMGFNGISGQFLMNRGTIEIADVVGGMSYGIYTVNASTALNQVDVSTGDAGTTNVGIYAIGGAVGNHLVMTNNVVVTGDSTGDNVGLLLTSIDSSVGNNVIIAGDGTNRYGIYDSAGGPLTSDPVFFNNHVETGSASGDSFHLLLLSGAPFIEFRLLNNNFDGNSDCILQDGCACTDDIDTVNECTFFGCGEAGGNISEDADFAGGDDFHPNAGSPLIDAGVNPFAYLPAAFADWGWYDMDGNARPQGAGWDIGAYEIE